MARVPTVPETGIRQAMRTTLAKFSQVALVGGLLSVCAINGCEKLPTAQQFTGSANPVLVDNSHFAYYRDSSYAVSAETTYNFGGDVAVGNISVIFYYRVVENDFVLELELESGELMQIYGDLRLKEGQPSDGQWYDVYRDGNDIGDLRFPSDRSVFAVNLDLDDGVELHLVLDNWTTNDETASYRINRFLASKNTYELNLRGGYDLVAHDFSWLGQPA